MTSAMRGLMFIEVKVNEIVELRKSLAASLWATLIVRGVWGPVAWGTLILYE